MEIPLIILGALFGILFFYMIIERAVRDGINNSVIGQYLDKKHGIKEPQGDEDLYDDTFKGE
ncbi:MULTISPECIES: hypothetical protein [Rossellomorea]|uniref:hypothetical protein n=1 Tax=Rossellomorea TaxID=2837508 RepID=UPI001CCD7E7D|nr:MULTISPECIES: hypothetical protein [Rossellomorea]MCA0149885.1 hypothetical protein [Rossellomorea vietnamensis]WGG46296.1 hypothetical protein P8596_03455 [Rossellomorea sp. DA94]